MVYKWETKQPATRVIQIVLSTRNEEILYCNLSQKLYTGTSYQKVKYYTLILTVVNNKVPLLF